ncbi:hydrophobic surface binding protein A-domain-containing protein [Pseudomassariella vexata]|uniref:Hydrophobic surface binding protein A-domain-containing protein n=1 Tax=Pseudomassariella vexata TaxID=1141098 RepID=A0A1Y2DK95_9PEZI|nr:hydrophobic surface binding protein A-domain-containing protein [Pseudomassariella vexata]ORY59690.1 hydrophobic surface binding protein A-domain-containing protein [Pseudomassariella vexata]
MKLSTTLSITAFAVSAKSQSLLDYVRRDVATISNVIKTVGDSLMKLDGTVQAFNGQDFTALGGDAATLITTLKTATEQIKATTPITLQEALTLQSSLGPIQDVGTKLVTHIVDKKPQFQQAGLCEVLFTQSQDLGAQGKNLIDATVSKVPQQVQEVAGQVTAGFTDTLNQVAGAFAPGNCTNGAAAGGTAAAAGSVAASNSTTNAGSRPQGSTTPNASAAVHVAASFLLTGGAFAVALAML